MPPIGQEATPVIRSRRPIRTCAPVPVLGGFQGELPLLLRAEIIGSPSASPSSGIATPCCHAATRLAKLKVWGPTARFLNLERQQRCDDGINRVLCALLCHLQEE